MNMLARAALLLSLLAACVFPAPAVAQTIVTKSASWSAAHPTHMTTGTLTAAGSSNYVQLQGDFNFSLWGTFSATCALERSFDGITWLPLSALGTSITWTGPTSETLSEPEFGVAYHVKCSPVTSGTVNYRVSQ